METIEQPKITGYRQLSEAEAGLMNEIKAQAIEVGELVMRLRRVCSDPDPAAPRIDPRWFLEGEMQLQQGFMALTRAVAKPTTF